MVEPGLPGASSWLDWVTVGDDKVVVEMEVWEKTKKGERGW